MCCVIPPASCAATDVLRRVSSKVVFPWSTWPIIVTIEGRNGRDERSFGIGLGSVNFTVMHTEGTSQMQRQHQHGARIRTRAQSMMPSPHPKLPSVPYIYELHHNQMNTALALSQAVPSSSATLLRSGFFQM